MQRSQVDMLDPRLPHWVAAVEAPTRDWAAAPGCRAHARFLVNGETMAPSRTDFELFESRGDCLAWMMSNRLELSRRMPGARIHAVPLASWLLGLE